MSPIHGFVEVERVPTELIRDLAELVSVRIGVVCRRFSGLERRVCRRGQDSVQPCLLVLVARRGECCA